MYIHHYRKNDKFRCDYIGLFEQFEVDRPLSLHYEYFLFLSDATNLITLISDLNEVKTNIE